MKNRKLINVLSIILLSFSIFITGCSDDELYDDGDYSSEASLTDKYSDDDSDTSETKAPDRSDASSFTLMVYMCGSDLESEAGAATMDMIEMMEANIDESLNIIVETGGANEWQNLAVDGGKVQRFKLFGGDLEYLEDRGRKQITDSSELVDFISFSANNYPADRYGIIFWDHGGGTVGGYGADELYDGSSMNISDLASALDSAGIHFDMIGFDCCLMATVENANALAPYGDYLIASEETEPGSGWFYTTFINELSNDPGIAIPKLSRTIINDYVSNKNTDISSGVTLSLIDLQKIDNLMTAFYNYLGSSEQALLDGDFSRLSNARSDAKSFGNDGFDQIDLQDFVEKTALEGSDELIAAIDEAVLLNGTNMRSSNGLAMYFPYKYSEYYTDISMITDDAGLDDDNYKTFFNDFVTVMMGGQASGGGNSNPYSNEPQEVIDYTETLGESWYNEEIAESYADSYSYVDPDELEITEKDGGYVLQLSEDDWEQVTDIDMEVYIDDGEGYLELGYDDCYEFDDDGDLIIDFDYQWMSLNGMYVPYYFFEQGEYTDGSLYSLGYATATVNDEKDVRIWIIYDEDGSLSVLGYTPDSDYEDGFSVASKGFRDFKDGDKIDFYFEYYDYDGEYQDGFTLENNYIIYDESEGLTASYEDIGELDTQICFHLNDVYGNEYWTEYLNLSM